jgi:hypothetical protein
MRIVNHWEDDDPSLSDRITVRKISAQTDRSYGPANALYSDTDLGFHPLALPESLGGQLLDANGLDMSLWFQFFPDMNVLDVVITGVTLVGRPAIIKDACHTYHISSGPLTPYKELTETKTTPSQTYSFKRALVAVPLSGQNIYHWLFEGLPRITCKLDALRRSTDLVLIVPQSFSSEQNFIVESLEILGLFQLLLEANRIFFIGSEHTIHVEELQLLDWRLEHPLASHVHVPEAARAQTIHAGALMLSPVPVIRNAKEAVEKSLALEKTLEENRLEQDTKDVIIWISRAADDGTAGNSGLRMIRNEAEVIAALEATVRDLGPSFEFRVHFGGNSTLREAHHLFRDAILVVGSHGAGLANIFFCRPGAGVLEIATRNPNHQMYKHAAAALNLHYWSHPGMDWNIFERKYIDIPVEQIVKSVRVIIISKTLVGGASTETAV